MAIAYTFRSSVHTTTGANSYATTSAFTPAAHSLMVAVVRATGNSGTVPSSVQTTSATNRYTFAEVYNNASGTNYFGIWVADSGATPPNDTITATVGGNSTGGHVSVVEVTGANMTGTALQAIVANATATSGTGTTATITYAAASNALNRQITATAVAANLAITERANWTELDDGTYTSPSDAMETQGRTDAFETTSTSTWTGSNSWVQLGIEIQAALSGDSVGMIPIF